MGPITWRGSELSKAGDTKEAVKTAISEICFDLYSCLEQGGDWTPWPYRPLPTQLFCDSKGTIRCLCSPGCHPPGIAFLYLLMDLALTISQGKSPLMNWQGINCMGTVPHMLPLAPPVSEDWAPGELENGCPSQQALLS